MDAIDQQEHITYLLEAYELSGRSLERMPDAGLNECISVLGLEEVGRLLTAYHESTSEPLQQAAPSASTSTFATTASRPKQQLSRGGIEQFILDHCRQAYAAVEELLRELDWRLVPAVLGEIPVRAEPWGVCISNLGRLSRCSWMSGRDGLVDSLQLVDGDVNTATNSKHPFVESMAIEPISGTSRVNLGFDVDRLARLASSDEWSHLAGQWRAGFLQPSGEFLCLRWFPAGTDRSTSPTRVPADLVCQGYVAEGWTWANQLGFSTEEQIALQMLGVPLMRKALEDDEVCLAVGDTFEVEKCKGNLDARQKSLCEYVENLFH